MLEDPTAPAIYRTSGKPPYPTSSNPQIPETIVSRQVTLRDRITIASLIPFSNPNDVPPRLLSYLCSQMNLEIEKGDTYPMMTAMPLTTFGTYWFQNFGAIMLLGEVGSVQDVARMEERGDKWEELCLGSFYIKPNYPGRSSHVCNGGFLVTEAARNRGVGRLMGEGYLEWAPKLVRTEKTIDIDYSTSSCIPYKLNLFNYDLGLHLLCLQPRLRNKRSILPYLGCSGLQAYRADKGLWKPPFQSR